MKLTLVDGAVTLKVREEVYGDGNEFLLLPRGTWIICAYKIYENGNEMRMIVTASEMGLDLTHVPRVKFSNPLRNLRRGGARIDLDELKREAEEDLRLQLRERLFLSPVMIAEFVLHEDRTPINGPVAFGEDSSGNRTVTIGGGYTLTLSVKQDILFSAPSDEYWGFWRRVGTTKQSGEP